MSDNSSEIKDISLAHKGLERLEWVRERMPIMRHLKARISDEQPFKGLHLGICLHVEAKTGVWLEALIAGGAGISITGSPGTTQDEVAAALTKEYGVKVFARRDESFDDHLQFAERVLESEPDLIIDNGADLHFLLHQHETFAQVKHKIIGATEETTSGGYRLREELEEQAFPTIVINDSRAKRIIENRYGVGLSVVDGIMRCTNILLNGLKIAVIGYGYCGRGVAICLRNLGAHVTVVEIDPLTCLDAHLEGFEVGDLGDAIPKAEMVITVTGSSGILAKEQFADLKDGAILVNAGHFEFEIDVAGLREIATDSRQIRENIESFDLENGKKLFLLAKGNPVNLAGGDGNPIEVMDLGLALQTLSLIHLIENSATMEHKPQNVPAEVESEVSKMALEAWTK
ncbi:MAG: adenosylhomocysteinase [Pyrinomonadaceae bacterium]|nr:adenosylhomocysteinase [Pyrinomonadaceae bacterium]